MRLAFASMVALFVGCGGHDPGAGGDAGGGDGNATTDATAATDAIGANPSTVTLTLNNRPNNAATFTFVVAYQDGSSPWVIAPAPTGDTYSFKIYAPAYGVAWTCIASVPNPNVGGAVSLRVVNAAYFAKAERTAVTMDIPQRCTDRITTVGLSGAVTNSGGGFLNVQFGERSGFANGIGNYAFETPPSTHDLIVTHLSPTGSGTDYAVDNALVQRAVTINATTTRNIDFSAKAATQAFAVTASGPIGARISTTTTLYSGHGTTSTLVSETAGPFATVSLNATQMLAGDVYDQSITMTVPGSGQTATTTNATPTPGAITYVAPAPLGTVASSVATKNPYPEIATTWPAYGNTIGYTWLASQQLPGNQCGGNGTSPCQIVWTTYLSPGVTGGSPAYQMPDLSALSGWSARFQLVTGTPVVGTVQAMTSSAGAGDFPAGKPAAGTQRAFVRSDWTVTP